MATREPLPRAHHAAVGIGSKLYVWGGYGGSSKIKSTALEIFDVTSLSWQQEALRGCDMPDGLWGMAVTSDRETAYCCCGKTGSSPKYTYYNTVFEITPSQHLCKELRPTSPSFTSPPGTLNSRVVQFQDKLILCGGFTSQKQTNELHVFDLKKSECELWYWIHDTCSI